MVVSGAPGARFPEAPVACDLARWDRLEAGTPTLFARMYQFWRRAMR